MTNYDREPDMPGVFIYSSGDCRDHGVNVPFAAARGGSSPKLCVACMLVELQRCAPPEVRKPLQHVPLSNEDVAAGRLRYGPGVGR